MRDSVAAAAVLLVCAAPASAQVAGGDIDLQAFRPAVDARGFITVNSSEILGRGEVSLGLVTAWGHGVLRLAGDAAPPPGYAAEGGVYAVQDLLTPSLQAAVGLGGIELGATLPFVVVAGDVAPDYLGTDGDPRDDAGFGFSAQGVGDVAAHAKVRLLDGSRHGVGLALVATLALPAHGGGRWLGEGGPVAQPALVLDREALRGRLRLGVNLGARVRLGAADARAFTDAEQPAEDGRPAVPATGATVAVPTAEAPFGVAAAWSPAAGRLELLAEVFGAVPLGGEGYLPLEAVGGVKLYLARNSFFLVGAGAGLARGRAASPDARVFAGVVFEPRVGDRDGDGLKDDVDRCPDDPEDHDDFEDLDGCPDPDNDRDLVLDDVDRCPNEPEDKDGVEDADGCPEPDVLDRDGDHIPDAEDACPDDPEDADGFRDADGCPDPDNDGDRVLDVDDLCPDDPEDADGWEDRDGCPDPDNDRDRILDRVDGCPDQPENYNGVEDDDGCPDRDIARRAGGEIVIFRNIYFRTDSAVIRPDSFPVLDAVAATIRANPDIRLLEIQGHADERGSDAHNLHLTQDRAEAVRRYLVDRGVEPGRLAARGYGESRPKVEGHDERAWSKNRRVEFIILEQGAAP